MEELTTGVAVIIGFSPIKHNLKEKGFILTHSTRYTLSIMMGMSTGHIKSVNPSSSAGAQPLSPFHAV